MQKVQANKIDFKFNLNNDIGIGRGFELNKSKLPYNYIPYGARMMPAAVEVRTICM